MLSCVIQFLPFWLHNENQVQSLIRKYLVIVLYPIFQKNGNIMSENINSNRCLLDIEYYDKTFTLTIYFLL